MKLTQGYEKRKAKPSSISLSAERASSSALSFGVAVPNLVQAVVEVHLGEPGRAPRAHGDRVRAVQRKAVRVGVEAQLGLLVHLAKHAERVSNQSSQALKSNEK